MSVSRLTGFFSGITGSISDWWYGKSTSQATPTSLTKEKNSTETYANPIETIQNELQKEKSDLKELKYAFYAIALKIKIKQETKPGKVALLDVPLTSDDTKSQPANIAISESKPKDVVEAIQKLINEHEKEIILYKQLQKQAKEAGDCQKLCDESIKIIGKQVRFIDRISDHISTAHDFNESFIKAMKLCAKHLKFPDVFPKNIEERADSKLAIKIDDKMEVVENDINNIKSELEVVKGYLLDQLSISEKEFSSTAGMTTAIIKNLEATKAKKSLLKSKDFSTPHSDTSEVMDHSNLDSEQLKNSQQIESVMNEVRTQALKRR